MFKVLSVAPVHCKSQEKLEQLSYTSFTSNFKKRGRDKVASALQFRV